MCLSALHVLCRWQLGTPLQGLFLDTAISQPIESTDKNSDHRGLDSTTHNQQQ